MIKFLVFSLLISYTLFALDQKDCSICLDPLTEAKAISIDSLPVPSCKDCFLKYVETQINDGNFQIPDLRAHKVYVSHLGHTGSENQKIANNYFYDNEFIVAFLQLQNRDDLLEKYMDNNRIYQALKTHKVIMCPHRDCRGMFKKPEEEKNYLPIGELCSECGRQYQKPEYDDKTLKKARVCPFCSGLVIKDKGCPGIFCGHCRRDIDYSSAIRAKEIYGDQQKTNNKNTCILF